MTTSVSPTDTLSTSKFQTLNNEVRRALAVHAEQPERDDIWQELLKLRRSVAEVIAGLSSSQKSGAMVETAFMLLHAFEESGMADQPATREDLALAEQYRRRNWPGLVASMILVPAWQSPEAPLMDDVQPWLWAEYTRWLFYTPRCFTEAGQGDAYAAHYLKRLEELAGWASRNRGAAAVKAAVLAYQNTGNSRALYVSNVNLKRHFLARARILGVIAGSSFEEDLVASPCEGRLVRIGFVARSYDGQDGAPTCLPLFEELSPDQFQVVLYCMDSSGSEVETHCRSRASEFVVLPKNTDEQLSVMRTGMLDILVFCGDLSTQVDALALLAVHRIACLQIVAGERAVTSGFTQCDLYLSDGLSAAGQMQDQFGERLGLVAGPICSLKTDAVDETDTQAFLTREMLGLPDGAALFVNASSLMSITPEMQQIWAGLLASVPGSRLLLNPVLEPGMPAKAVRTMCASFDRILGAHGVELDRLIVSDVPLRTRRDFKGLVRSADVYLDVYPCSQPESCMAALELGLPVVTMVGAQLRSRTTAGLLLRMGLDAMVVEGETQYRETAAMIATDQGRRGELSRMIVTRIEHEQVCWDSLAAGDAFGALASAALDEIALNGREAFRKASHAFSLPRNDAAQTIQTARSLLDAGLLMDACKQMQGLLAVEPVSVAARHMMGQIQAAMGRWQRAIDYLLAAVQSHDAKVVVWRDLSNVLKQSGNGKDAIAALETAIRMDQKDPESWFALGELAREQGHQDLIRQVGEIVASLAPDDPRTALYATSPSPVN